jgi:hypothetical protein
VRRLTIALAWSLSLPAAAGAAPLGELPFQPLPDRGPALCLTATGAPGGIALLGPFSRRQSATDLLTVGTGGATRTTRVRLGRLLECAAAAEAPGGAAVIAGAAVDADFETALRAVVRDPGATFGPPATLSESGIGPVAAIGPAGHAVVAWTETRPGRHRIVAARRAPGGAFGAAETLVRWRTDREMPEVDLAATVDARGTAALVWTRELASDDFDEHVEAATAASGAPFAIQRLASGVSTFDRPVLAGAADGWALAAFDTGDGLPHVFQRPPGGAFEPVVLPDPPGRVLRAYIALAVRDGGGAIIAWMAGGSASTRGIEATTRASAGPFGPIRRVATRPPPTRGDDDELGILNLFDFQGAPPRDDVSRRLDAAVSRDGRVVLAWTDVDGRPPVRVEAVHAVTGRLDGKFEAAQWLGAPLRPTADLVPLVLDDGRAAVAWTDNAGAADGRLHVAVEGAPATARAAAPRLTLRAPRFQRLFASQSPRLVAACDRPCDIRAKLLGSDGDPVARTRLRAPSAPLAVGPTARIAPGKSRTVRIVVRASAPGGRRTTVRSVRIRVARRPALPLQRPIEVSAERRGDVIVVRWRTAAPARRQYFLVAGGNWFLPGMVALVPGNGRTRFSMRLPGARVRRVTVVALSVDSGAERATRVRVD